MACCQRHELPWRWQAEAAAVCWPLHQRERWVKKKKERGGRKTQQHVGEEAEREQHHPEGCVAEAATAVSTCGQHVEQHHHGNGPPSLLHHS